MRHTQDEILVFQEIAADDKVFRLEEFWEEDDAGFCCVDYVLAKHTRLAVYSAADLQRLRIFDLDSKEYDKSMELADHVLTVTYHPDVDVEKICRIHTGTLDIIG